MNVEYHKWWSPNLGQEIELKVYGTTGKPVIIFPTQAGRFYDFENFGMVSASAWWINSGKIQLYTVDSIDNQSWANWTLPPIERGLRHEDYDRYIIEEIVPLIRQRCKEGERFMAAGCDMGGYHAQNFFFRHPDVFDAVISMSGYANLTRFVGDYSDDTVYYNSPLLYLPNLEDEWYLNQIRKSKIIICVGKGLWEGENIDDAEKLAEILAEKKIPAWVDFWGDDVNHDWQWWRKQWPYFLNSVKL